MLERFSGTVKPQASLTAVCSARDVIAMQDMVGTVYCLSLIHISQAHAQVRLLGGHHLGRVAQRHHHIRVGPHAGTLKERAQQRAQVRGGRQIRADQAQAHLRKVEGIGRGGCLLYTSRCV